LFLSLVGVGGEILLRSYFILKNIKRFDFLNLNVN